jgi:type I restriction enzyme, S subunit
MNWKTVRLEEIAFQEAKIIQPNSREATNLPFLGLEQIASDTGQIISYETNTAEGKSTAFAFDTSHVLYGKLRPYLNKVAVPDREGRCSTEIIPLRPIDTDRNFLGFLLRTQQVVDAAMAEKTGSRMPRADVDILLQLEVSIPDSLTDQIKIAAALNVQLAEVAKARVATICQLREVGNLANAIIYESLSNGPTTTHSLGDVLAEVKHGIGSGWASYPVYGATRAGLALAKEPPGKTPQRYKPVRPGTVFYNPMRILIGSIAYAEADTEPGITSPDYVVLTGKTGLVDSRWFYYWLRSPLGEQCITSLARGAVRERMLFNRLAEGQIDLPDFAAQQRASEALTQLQPMRSGLKRQLFDLLKMPPRLLSAVFEGSAV